MDVKSTVANSYQILFGDLSDSNGLGTYWLAINNTYQVNAMVSLDCLGFGFGLPPAYTKRFRFGIGTTKFPQNTTKKLIVKRVGGVISASLDGVAFPETYTDNSGFAPVSNTPFAIGGSSDGKYLFSGTISNIHIEM